MYFYISNILSEFYTKYKDCEKTPIIRLNVETKFNSFNGILEFEEYLIHGDYIKLNNSTCPNMGDLKIDKSIISVQDIVSFAYTDFETFNLNTAKKD